MQTRQEHPRTPTRIKKLRGTAQPCRTNPHEPAPRPGVPEPPEFLDEVARAEWDRLAPQLQLRGLLEEIDLAMLTAHVTAWSQLCRAQRAVAVEGEVVIDEAGRVRTSPYAALAEKARAQLIITGREFGLSPSARTSVRAAPPPVDPVAAARRERFLGLHRPGVSA